MAEELRKDCEILKIDLENLCELTMRDIVLAYRKESLRVHPDKVAKDPKSQETATAAFQALYNSYERILNFVFHNNDKDTLNENCNLYAGQNEQEQQDENFMKDNFEHFNFPFENDGSFTVKIQHYQAEYWQLSLESEYGKPSILMVQ